MGKVIGIDLGTTNSAVAIIEDGDGKIIENLDGKRTTPSIIAFKGDEILVGETAKRQMVTNPTATFYEIKRLIGRRFDDPEVTKMKDKVAFDIIKGDNGDAWVQVGDKKYAPAQISAEVLKYLKKSAETYLGEEVSEAVITVPAYFNDSQRKATKNAGKLAGLKVERVVNEPTAAALAYGMDQKNETSTIAVYDLGGGTFDVSILEVESDADTGNVIQVKSTNGDTFLGGGDFDNRIIDYLAEEFKKEHGVDLRDDVTSRGRLKEAAEKAKIELSSRKETDVTVPFIHMKDGAPLNLDINLTRAKYEELVQDLVDRTIKPIEAALKDAGLTINDVDEVILVGGMTRMPKVVETVKNHFGKDPHRGVNPDEVVADGAALQGGIITGELEDVLLMDVTPLTLGLRVKGGVFAPIIDRNTTIPCTKTVEDFSTAEDNQTSVMLRIHQGEREMADDNKLLGEFNLDGIPPAPQGVAKIAVTFDIDADGILTVSAKEQKTGKEQKIRIEAGGGLTDEEVEAMLKDAEANAEKDKARREAVEAENKAGALIKSSEDITKEDYYNDAPEDIRKEFQDAVEELKLSYEGNKEGLVEKVKKVEAATSKLGEAFYAASEKSEGEGGEEAPANDDATADVDADADAEATPTPAQKKGNGGPSV